MNPKGSVKKVKHRLIYCGGILSIMCVVAWLTVMPFKFLDNFYLGAFHYSFHDEILFKDERKNIILEPNCFSYLYKFPYVYLYGISGYSKINILPLYGNVEKIVNMGFYNTIPTSTTDYPLKSLDALRDSYGTSLITRASMAEVDSEDKLIFAKLQKQGKEKYEVHMKVRQRIDHIYEIPKYMKWWNGLDRLNLELNTDINR